ncbi:TPA: helix-turn-helix domain-containing protein [Cronobacter sakazakii]|uniref:helix-turn-helix transcriptional regulator n=1 Tax=Enterobacteriaceae TaxID=543 RepID=UPI000A18AE31|nr:MULTISPECIES: helix-turn-helix domain-containing protein [Enterobacteriaceae]EKF8821428.1 helix-turn-helix domain-containing protein [Cronobacter sakazakii]ELY4089615.1 helix-turn-helix domain-containing protein [Cronobacter sakazakii]EMC4264273.1 helix-turn-helix domain-containing protein [Cronobacter sakazakii]EMC4334371.1 helix-turn-helix domain-containing protein [Cronobacter sakazakii]KAB0871683.1 helix-turn-helix domain-containing protein [Cronobacter sakazakii]
MKSIYDIRRENLSDILRRDFDGKQSRLAERMGIQPNLVSRWENGVKNIGSNSARRIEEAARRDSHWLDVDHELAQLAATDDSDEVSTDIGTLAASTLRTWMEQNGQMSQQRVADASGVSQATINRFLRQEASITLNNLAAIAEAFGRRAYEMILPKNDASLIEYDHSRYAALPEQEKAKIRSFIEFVMSQNNKQA